MAARGTPVPPTQAVTITEVWEDNLEEAFIDIRELVDKFPYIAMVRHGHTPGATSGPGAPPSPPHSYRAAG